MLKKAGEYQLDGENEEVLQKVEQQSNIRQTIKEGRLTGLVTSWVGTAL
jgi:hypothetical protein